MLLIKKHCEFIMQNQIMIAIKKAGGASKVAKRAKIARTSVYKWAYLRVPADRVLLLSEMSGIPCYLIRPDIYPNHEQQKDLSDH